MGYDAMHDQYVDMMKSGIIDPTKVPTLLSRHSSRICLLVYVKSSGVCEVSR